MWLGERTLRWLAVMGERDGDRRTGRTVLLVGAGARARELGAVLSALAAVRAEERGDKAVEPLRPQGFKDLEELLAQRPEEGLLILETGRVPGEDIGFVRRFLERHPVWRLVLIGEDARDPRAKTLLALPRAQWLPWPPDLDQLAALLGPQAAREPSDAGARRRANSRTERGKSDGLGPEEEGAPTGVDVGELFEELLAGAALQGEGAPRVQFRCEEPAFVAWERGLLGEGLTGLFELARRCAGAEGLVRAEVERTNGSESPAVRIALDFPLAGLAEKDLPELLERPFEGDPRLAEGVSAARNAARVLRAAGGRVDLASERGRARCRVELASLLAAPGKNRTAPRATKPEDPFA